LRLQRQANRLVLRGSGYRKASVGHPTVRYWMLQQQLGTWGSASWASWHF